MKNKLMFLILLVATLFSCSEYPDTPPTATSFEPNHYAVENSPTAPSSTSNSVFERQQEAQKSEPTPSGPLNITLKFSPIFGEFSGYYEKDNTYVPEQIHVVLKEDPNQKTTLKVSKREGLFNWKDEVILIRQNFKVVELDLLQLADNVFIEINKDTEMVTHLRIGDRIYVRQSDVSPKVTPSGNYGLVWADDIGQDIILQPNQSVNSVINALKASYGIHVELSEVKKLNPNIKDFNKIPAGTRIRVFP